VVGTHGLGLKLWVNGRLGRVVCTPGQAVTKRRGTATCMPCPVVYWRVNWTENSLTATNCNLLKYRKKLFDVWGPTVILPRVNPNCRLLNLTSHLLNWKMAHRLLLSWETFTRFGFAKLLRLFCFRVWIKTAETKPHWFVTSLIRSRYTRMVLGRRCMSFDRLIRLTAEHTDRGTDWPTTTRPVTWPVRTAA